MNAEHYCHHCRYWSALADGVHCAYCLAFWQANRRMPLPGDRLPATDALSRAYAAMGWEMPK
jgi:hypothetical protein